VLYNSKEEACTAPVKLPADAYTVPLIYKLLFVNTKPTHPLISEGFVLLILLLVDILFRPVPTANLVPNSVSVYNLKLSILTYKLAKEPNSIPSGAIRVYEPFVKFRKAAVVLVTLTPPLPTVKPC